MMTQHKNARALAPFKRIREHRWNRSPIPIRSRHLQACRIVQVAEVLPSFLIIPNRQTCFPDAARPADDGSRTTPGARESRPEIARLAPT